MSKRRTFIKSATVLGAATLLPNTGWGNELTPSTLSRIKPKKLKKGDTIGLVAPGYAIKPEVLEKALATLKEMGFKTYHTERLIGNYGYFSNTDEERAKDVNEMFANPKIDGILCARGGYGCTRILDQLDYESIKKNPKVLIGFSDITALIQAIYKETGLVCFHGPVGSTIDDAYSQKYFKKVLMKGKDSQKIKNAKLTDSKFLENPEYNRYTITPGTCEGELAGGSLTLVNALIGTPHEIDFTDKLVFLEDVEEAPYRIDRMLTQLIEGATFKKAKGVVFGVCKGCNRERKEDNFTLKEVIMDRIASLGMPAAYGMSFGHVPNNFTLPVGVQAAFNADEMSLELLEAAVS
ncbi:S66 peptidase family protein [Flagellimonas aequoris]|uniref:LD-carboxypeptidase n=1 Tax=Flagellimonas aequoris TaxID=2306997 RepID=A0A418N9D5_9FLAO|nr:LD-carboxypeptidase [Allomuricauda aequoris]RIV72341.1 LD-carboxypeptidase [Allomuricauda aequoris]TXK04366.1 LD-carboxypeptidase [Allomuricauda aequoris]